jgi:hypothetical protein
MINLGELHGTVARTLASKRVGTPVFVRYLLHTQEKQAVRCLAQIAGVVRDWIGQGLERVYALGSVKGGQTTLTLEFAGGATALVSWTSSPGRSLGVDLMVIGNHGAMYHDAGHGLPWEEPVGLLQEAPAQELVALVERALRSGQPEIVGGKP